VTLSDRILLAGGVAAAFLVGAAAWLFISASASATPPDGRITGALESAGSQTPAPSRTTDGELVVDIEGGVVHPGIARLPPGSRVADAIAAAGGYADSADLAAAARTLNLASELTDGAQVYVPRLGDVAGGGTGTGSGGGSGGGGGLVDLNHATESELDALPGIGPVTVGKIVAAREEQPFQTLDELVDRKVMTSAQLDKIRDLAAVG
jgi:competence protein ComEA